MNKLSINQDFLQNKQKDSKSFEIFSDISHNNCALENNYTRKKRKYDGTLSKKFYKVTMNYGNIKSGVWSWLEVKEKNSILDEIERKFFIQVKTHKGAPNKLLKPDTSFLVDTGVLSICTNRDCHITDTKLTTFAANTFAIYKNFFNEHVSDEGVLEPTGPDELIMAIIWARKKRKEAEPKYKEFCRFVRAKIEHSAVCINPNGVTKDGRPRWKHIFELNGFTFSFGGKSKKMKIYTPTYEQFFLYHEHVIKNDIDLEMAGAYADICELAKNYSARAQAIREWKESEKCFRKKYTIEHNNPKKITRETLVALGEDPKSMRGKYFHSSILEVVYKLIGPNLTYQKWRAREMLGRGGVHNGRLKSNGELEVKPIHSLRKKDGSYNRLYNILRLNDKGEYSITKEFVKYIKHAIEWRPPYSSPPETHVDSSESPQLRV